MKTIENEDRMCPGHVVSGSLTVKIPSRATGCYGMLWVILPLWLKLIELD